MTVAFKRIAYACGSGVHYYPFWRVDFEINGKPFWRDVQAQTAICAQHAICHALGVPFRAIWV
jgi:hypothetical protein